MNVWRMSTGHQAAPRYAASIAQALAHGGVPSGMRARGGTTDAGRFGVYRNNVGAGLVRALQQRFPVVRRLVGEAFFDAMAAPFAAAERPSSPVLLLYGDRFPAWIEGFEPAATLPYLADVARLEMLLATAYHAADTTALTLSDLGALPSDRLAEAIFSPHPSAGLLRSRHPVGTIWSAHQSEPVAAVRHGSGEAVLVTRSGDRVRLTVVDSADAGFMAAILRGIPVGTAACGHGSEPGRALVALTGLGALAAFSLADEQS